MVPMVAAWGTGIFYPRTLSFLTLPRFPVFCPGDIQGAALFFASKMMVPSEKGLFTTFMAKLSSVGELLRAPKKVRRISK